MDKPEWFACAYCLLSIRSVKSKLKGQLMDVSYFCTFKEKNVEYDYFCKEWVCKNCWNPWNDWKWDKETDKEYRIDHSKCEKIDVR